MWSWTENLYEWIADKPHRIVILWYLCRKSSLLLLHLIKLIDNLLFNGLSLNVILILMVDQSIFIRCTSSVQRDIQMSMYSFQCGHTYEVTWVYWGFASEFLKQVISLEKRKYSYCKEWFCLWEILRIEEALGILPCWCCLFCESAPPWIHINLPVWLNYQYLVPPIRSGILLLLLLRSLHKTCQWDYFNLKSLLSWQDGNKIPYTFRISGGTADCAEITWYNCVSNSMPRRASQQLVMDTRRLL